MSRLDRSGRLMAWIATTLWTLGLGSVTAGLGIAWFAGWKLEVIRSESMEPTVPQGSLAVVLPLAASQIEADDVIAFRDPSDHRRRLLHRVVQILDRRESGTGVFFKTQGDANKAPDPLYVSSDDVFGRMRWHVPKLGTILWNLRPPFGFAALVALPAALLAAGRLLWKRPMHTGPEIGKCPRCGRALHALTASVTHLSEADSLWALPSRAHYSSTPRTASPRRVMTMTTD